MYRNANNFSVLMLFLAETGLKRLTNLCGFKNKKLFFLFSINKFKNCGRVTSKIEKDL